jgi:hypothetical protein
VARYVVASYVVARYVVARYVVARYAVAHQAGAFRFAVRRRQAAHGAAWRGPFGEFLRRGSATIVTPGSIPLTDNVSPATDSRELNVRVDA